jgi:glycosyltransferase involved in cell wall biosynthesis
MDEDYESGLVSVIVPTYNRAQFLSTALDSVWNQTYRPIELIVVDDGSSDDTPSVVSRWADRHAGSRFKVRFRRQENSGAPTARNLGLIESRGEYIQFLDSDDALHPQKIGVQVSALEKRPVSDLAWSTHDTFDVEEESPVFRNLDPETLLVESSYVSETPIFGATGNVWTGLYRRELCRRAGPWNESLQRWQDLEYNARCMVQHPPTRYLDAELVSMGNHEAGRIQDLHRTPSGIRAGLRSLRAIEQTVDFVSTPEPTARRALSTFHVNLARSALKHGRSDLALPALNAATGNDRRWTFRMKVELIRMSHALFGPKASGRLMKSYSDWALS